MINYKEVFEKYGLRVEEVEPKVFKVLNTSLEVSIDELQWDLLECILITSLNIRRKKIENKISVAIANVYFIILDYKNGIVADKYDRLASEQYGETLYKPYKCNLNFVESIDTIYSKEELGK